MKLSTISKLAAVAALCVAGYIDAHAQTNVNNDASMGSNSTPTGNCTGLSTEGCNYYEGTTSIGSDACSGGCEGGRNSSSDTSNYIRLGPVNHTQSDAVITGYQKQLAHNAATADRLIEDNADILSSSCLVEVETLQRSLRNTYSSTGGQLPLNEPPFNRKSPEFRGYVAALVDQSRNTSMQIADMVALNCWDPDATSFYRGEVVGAGWLK